MKKILQSFYADRSGQSLTEYALILAVVAVAVVGIMATLGTEITAAFQSIIDSFNGTSSS